MSRIDNQGIARMLFFSRIVVTGKAMSRRAGVSCGIILPGYYKYCSVVKRKTREYNVKHGYTQQMLWGATQ